MTCSPISVVVVFLHTDWEAQVFISQVFFSKSGSPYVAMAELELTTFPPLS